ncbi:MAG: competence/damage-inducible protein A [Solirubrobacterales bacterium]
MSAESVRAGVIVTGTEVLTGRITDRNGPWISERLGELGAEVSQIIVVGDRPGDLEAALRFFEGEGVDLVVTSGGLGPTADDLTAAVVADFAEREMELDEAMEARIHAILEGFARRMKFEADALREANRKQAMVPRGSIAIEPAGTAPGLVVPARDLVVIVLPGPPRELQAMWGPALATEPVRAVLDRTEPFIETTIRMFGIPESSLAQTLREIEQDVDLSPLEITTCLRRAEIVVDVRRHAADESLYETLVERLRDAHGRYLFSEDGSTIDEQVHELLSGRSIGIAESCTAGLLAARITEPPGASAYFRGGVVAYSDEVKTDLLAVPEALIEEHGAVSPEVADAMADGAIERFGAELGIGVTGIAGPDGGSEEKPVGYVCVCVKDRSGDVLARDPVLPGNRADIRDRSATVALHMLRRLLRGEDLPF